MSGLASTSSPAVVIQLGASSVLVPLGPLSKGKKGPTWGEGGDGGRGLGKGEGAWAGGWGS